MRLEVPSPVLARAGSELIDGSYVNLGIGLPALVPNCVPDDVERVLQSENGIRGVRAYPFAEEVDADLINAGKKTATLRRGASYFDPAIGFGMIRGWKIDAAIPGAMQVSAGGDVANRMVSGKIVAGTGGAVDLVHGAKRVIVLMEHVSGEGDYKIVSERSRCPARAGPSYSASSPTSPSSTSNRAACTWSSSPRRHRRRSPHQDLTWSRVGSESRPDRTARSRPGRVRDQSIL
jgi:3-oxoacid CoA-transferase subunit B